MKKLGLLLTAILLVWSIAKEGKLQANNISITGKPELVQKNSTAGTVFVSFQLTWENSWKVNNPKNWDAAWVFAKYREGGNDWQHIYIDTNHSAHKASAIGKNDAGSDIRVKTTLKVGNSRVMNKDKEETMGMGAFLYRTENGKGNILFDTVKLKWNYAAQGLDDEAVLSIRVFAIEMVYIPQGAFELGDRTNSGAWKDFYLLGDSSTLFTADIAWPFYASSYQAANYNKGLNASYGLFNANISTTQRLPAGALNTVYSTANPEGDGLNHYTYIEETNWLRVYRNRPHGNYQWASGQGLWHPGGSSSGIWMTTPAGVWNTITLKMPWPFRATHFLSGWWNWQTTGYQVRASNDSINWELVSGKTQTNAYTTTTWPSNVPTAFVNDSSHKAYSWYRFYWYSTTTVVCAITYQPVDITGFPENDNYYRVGQTNTIGNKTLQMPSSGNLFKTNTVDSLFPTGFRAFYIMKHELSQHAYVDFLNTLNFAQQNNRANTAKPNAAAATRFAAGYRNWVRVRESGTSGPAVYGLWVDGESTSPWIPEDNAGNVAMQHLSWADNAAYLCWSGLRPLTELEYEKACRGTKTAVKGEYAWGTTNVVGATAAPSNANKRNELANPTNANYISQGSAAYFPARVGCLAKTTTTRTEAGASFYGVLNLSDNVSEIYINISTIQGQRFSGMHGTGVLNGNGFADYNFLSWPLNNAVGTGIRGIYANANAQVSNRTNAETVITTANEYVGCRGGRTAP